MEFEPALTLPLLHLLNIVVQVQCAVFVQVKQVIEVSYSLEVGIIQFVAGYYRMRAAS